MIAFLDMPSGISGDMLLGCLVDAGWSPERLRSTIARLALPVAEWAIQIQGVQRQSLRATQVTVLADEGRVRRGLADVTAIIAAADLPTVVRETATAVFRRLADAEAKVHGTTVEQVHFHEVGAVDAIIDIVGGVAGLHELGVERLYASALPLGSGWTGSAHGSIPLPAPATLELLAAAGAPTRPAPGPGELVTPTGAALVAQMAVFEQPAMSLVRVGSGAGSRDLPWPNLARLWLGEGDGPGALVQLETNLDDMNPQLYPSVIEQLLAAGARDAWLTPVQMKKGRPGVVLAALGLAADELKLADIMFRQTSTLGVRVHAIARRHELRREMRDVLTPFGTVRAKLRWIGHELAGAMPEYDDCRLLAKRAGVPTRDVWEAAHSAAHILLSTWRDAAPRADASVR